ncbi:MAG: segregation/condensation protein A [Clostridia bacterium]|nr:segregation/condensation protein A [Clostridia bacterium]
MTDIETLDSEIEYTAKNDGEISLFDTEEDDSPKFKLEIFEGPLDLLLSLIAKNKVNIYDIPIAVILDQYMEYIHEMEMFNMDVASSFIVMAARLMLIKSRMLLPVQKDEEDPRQELVDMLLEYQRAKKTAEVLHDREFTYWGRYEKPAEDIGVDPEYKLTHDIEILKEALHRILARNDELEENTFEMEQNIGKHLTATRQVSVGEKIVSVLKSLAKKDKQRLDSFFDKVQSRGEVVATFLALLELIKGKRISITYYSDNYSDCDITLNREVEDEYQPLGENGDMENNE